MKKRFIALGLMLALGSFGVVVPEPVMLGLVEAGAVLF
tara:strand:- start:253 stop:366 length:114 start_codon:yes stop_codon:yes gene_type:complete